MPEPIVELLDEEWRALSDLGDRLPPEAWDLPTDCPGWSVRDCYAHLIGTERSLRGEPPPGEPVQAPHVKNPIGAANEAWVASRRGVPGADVLAEFREVTAGRLEELRGLPAERFEEIGWTPAGEGPYREFMSVRVMDSWVHEQDVRRAAGVPGHLEGPVVEHALDRLQRGVPMVVGKRADAPDGSTVVIDVTGPAARTIAVEVAEGRARIRTDVPDDPTARITLDTQTFACLMTGRWGRHEAAGRLALEGDQDLARRVVDGMNIMI